MEKYKNLEAILVISTGFLILYLLFGRQWMLYTALTVSVLSLISPTISRWINQLWFKLALALGWVNSRILLSLVFFIFLMPVAFLQRLISGDKLQLNKKKEGESYYVDRDYQYEKKDLENVW